jgi:prophage regulatory protein
MSRRVLRLPEVKALTGLSRSSIYLRISNNEFPECISLGSRTVGWLELDIQSWIESRIVNREKNQTHSASITGGRHDG